MSKFYCNVCEEDIILQNGKCPKCKTDWDKIINDNSKSVDAEPVNFKQKKSLFIEDDYVKGNNYSNVEEITDEDINRNISFFLNWGLIVKIILCIFGIAAAIGSFIVAGNMDELQREEFHTDVLYIIIGCISCFGFILAGIIFEKNLEWKAYMLKNTREINKKNR